MNRPMTARTLANLRAFLARVQLSGAEVPAYVEVMRWLEAVDAAASEAGTGRGEDA